MTKDEDRTRQQPRILTRWRTTREVSKPKTLTPQAEAAPQPVRLPPYLITGNRFGSVGLYLGILGLLCSLIPSVRAFAWVAALVGELLAIAGFVKYCRLGATNRDVAVTGALLGWAALAYLLIVASVELEFSILPL
jgi:hypothetical protein